MFGRVYAGAAVLPKNEMSNFKHYLMKDSKKFGKTKKGFKKFQTYIKLFSDSDTPWIKIESMLTREDSYIDRNYREKDDKNENYRLYDYPDFKTGIMKEGRLSLINKEEANVVVSLHINDMGSKNDTDNGGMGVVLTPSFQTFELLKRISEKKTEPEQFLNSNWNNWMIFEKGWSPLENAIADAWIYFHGYWPTKDGSRANLDRFEGFRYNMVTWKYKDDEGWEDEKSALVCQAPVQNPWINADETTKSSQHQGK
jgi:hypothetical protein